MFLMLKKKILRKIQLHISPASSEKRPKELWDFRNCNHRDDEILQGKACQVFITVLTSQVLLWGFIWILLCAGHTYVEFVELLYAANRLKTKPMWRSCRYFSAHNNRIKPNVVVPTAELGYPEAILRMHYVWIGSTLRKQWFENGMFGF